MKKKLPLSHRPFKKAHVYKDIEEAKFDGASDRVAEARLKAQETAKEIKGKLNV